MFWQKNKMKSVRGYVKDKRDEIEGEQKQRELRESR